MIRHTVHFLHGFWACCVPLPTLKSLTMTLYTASKACMWVEKKVLSLWTLYCYFLHCITLILHMTKVILSHSRGFETCSTCNKANGFSFFQIRDVPTKNLMGSQIVFQHQQSHVVSNAQMNYPNVHKYCIKHSKINNLDTSYKDLSCSGVKGQPTSSFRFASVLQSHSSERSILRCLTSSCLSEYRHVTSTT